MTEGRIFPADISEIESTVLDGDKLRPVPHEFYSRFSLNDLLLFMHKYGFYSLPTTELISFIKEQIRGTAIEIGAGNGQYGRALGIPITDNKMQTWKEVVDSYNAAGQPLIKYPDDIEELDYMKAIRKYNPETVFGSYITHKYKAEFHELGGNMHGVDGSILLQHVKRFIMVGNRTTHKLNPLLKKPHKEYKLSYLICRSFHQEDNRVFIWDK